jgi:hypothetical protein
MIEKEMFKPLKARSMHKLKELIAFAEDAGYKQKGKVIQSMDGYYSVMMSKIIVWGKRNEDI